MYRGPRFLKYAAVYSYIQDPPAIMFVNDMHYYKILYLSRFLTAFSPGFSTGTVWPGQMYQPFCPDEYRTGINVIFRIKKNLSFRPHPLPLPLIPADFCQSSSWGFNSTWFTTSQYNHEQYTTKELTSQTWVQSDSLYNNWFTTHEFDLIHSTTSNSQHTQTNHSQTQIIHEHELI